MPPGAETVQLHHQGKARLLLRVGTCPGWAANGGAGGRKEREKEEKEEVEQEQEEEDEQK